MVNELSIRIYKYNYASVLFQAYLLLGNLILNGFVNLIYGIRMILYYLLLLICTLIFGDCCFYFYYDVCLYLMFGICYYVLCIK